MSAETVAVREGLTAVRAGMSVETFGLRQDWVVLDLTVLDDPVATRPQGLLLAARDHNHTPFVIELVYIDQGVLVAYQGSYHRTLAEAVRMYRDRGGQAREWLA